MLTGITIAIIVLSLFYIALNLMEYSSDETCLSTVKLFTVLPRQVLRNFESHVIYIYIYIYIYILNKALPLQVQ